MGVLDEKRDPIGGCQQKKDVLRCREAKLMMIRICVVSCVAEESGASGRVGSNWLMDGDRV